MATEPKTKATCPVCGWEITDPHRATVGGQAVTVCSDECVRALAEGSGT
ncbi:MAG TPA: hypothetical protein VNK43_12160 [Gemmatimonadales bacterium]|nr:hypothetical protein [Gemmatimonadales bacterium]